VLAHFAEIDLNGLPSTSCYELMPHSVNGLREFSKTAIQRFLARKRTADFSVPGVVQAFSCKILIPLRRKVVTA
jgi:hypothetical protein